MDIVLLASIVGLPVYLVFALGMALWAGEMDSEIWWGDRVIGDFADRNGSSMALVALLWPLSLVAWYLLGVAMVVTYAARALWVLVGFLVLLILMLVSMIIERVGRKKTAVHV